MTDDELETPHDTFSPPKTPTLVGCLHCQEVYESYLIEWRVKTCGDGVRRGFWSCPTPDCGGVGFGCDILPIDREWEDEDGNRMWCEDEGEEDDEDEWDEDWDDGLSSDESKPQADEDIPF